MKKIIIIFVILFSSIGFYIFFQKNYLDFKIVSNTTNSNEPFSPMAYEFFHSEKSYDSFFERTVWTKNIKSNFPNVGKLDFENYSYCIFFGKSVKSLYYSYKTTYFDDPSPSYASARRYGKKCVFVVYEDEASDDKKGVYLYRVKRDNKLRGFEGL